MPMATRAGTKRAASAEPDREGDQHIVVRSELGSNNRIIWNLTPGRHTPAELVYAVRSTFDHGAEQTITTVRVTPCQPTVVTKTSRPHPSVLAFKGFYQSLEGQSADLTQAGAEVDEYVQEAFKLFDKYFFLNQVHKYTKVELVHGLAAHNRELGHAAADPVKGKPYQRIRLDYQGVLTWLHRDIGTVNIKNMKKVLGTLLHEMVHCVFRIFKCTCALCERDRPYMIGGCGHGFCWIDLSNAVQRVAREQFDSDLNLQCDEDGPSVRGFREGLNKRRRICS